MQERLLGYIAFRTIGRDGTSESKRQLAEHLRSSTKTVDRAITRLSNEGYIDDVPVGKILAFEAALHDHFTNTQGELIETINKTGNWNDDIEASFKKGISEFKTTGSW